MKLTYDPEADALDIRLREGSFQCRTVRLNDNVSLDFGEGEQLIAIEVLCASELGVTPEHPEVILDHLRGIAVSA